MQYHEYIRQNGRKPAAQSYRACKMAASCTFRTDYAFLWAQAVLFCWVRLETWVLKTSQKKESICMRTKKMRLVSALLALAMLFVMMPVGAFAYNPSPTKGNCGAGGANDNSVTWKVEENGDIIKDESHNVYLDKHCMTLTISGSGAMADYENSEDRPWKGWEQVITKIVINDGVTTIGEEAFHGCYKVTEIVLPDSVTSIGKRAFYYCGKLQKVVLSSNLTDSNLTAIGDEAFEGCSALENVEIPAGVKTIGDGAFSGCTSLGSVTIPNSVTDIGAYAFSSCSKLTSIEIPSSVTNIGAYAFSGCEGLGSVTNMNGVTNIGQGAFQNCSGLTNIAIPSSVTNIGAVAFQSCTGLTSINIPNGVTSIEMGTFYGCSGLNSITIPNSVTTIGPMTFGQCFSLKNIAIPSSVTTIGDDAFAMCVALKKITIPQQVGTIGERTFTACAQLEKIDIESDSNLTAVGDHAFETTNYYSNGQYYGKLSDMMDDLAELGVTELAETKIYCGAPLKKSGKLSDKGVAEENIIASVTVKLVDGEKTETGNVPYGGTVGTLEQPTKEGYTFVGWYGENGEVFDPAAPLTEDTTIHAEWKKNAAPTPTPAPAPVDDDSVDAGAVATTVVLGAGVAALTYHIGTELYAEQVLGKGVVVPTLRGDVARKAWELAGKPAVTVAGNEAPDEDAQAQQWVVDQGLMKDRKDGKFHPEQWMSKLKALRTLDAAKKLG